MFGHVGFGAKVLRHPHEVDGHEGRRQLAGSDKGVQRTRHFQHGCGTAGVVVGAPLGMVEMPGNEHFLLRRLRSANPGMDQGQLPGTKGRVNFAVNPYRSFAHEVAHSCVLIG